MSEFYRWQISRQKDLILSFKSFLPSLPYAYGLPKIHKPNCPVRPIISFRNSPSFKLSKYLAGLLSPSLGSFSDSHLKNSMDLLSRLCSLKISSNDYFLSFDAVSLFTNAHLEPTIEFLSRKLAVLNLDLPVDIDCVLE